MADFAPAILRCAEIVEEAEGAELTIKKSAERITKLQTEIVGLEGQVTANRHAVSESFDELAAAKADIAAQKTKLIANLKVTQDKLDAATAGLVAMQDEHKKLTEQYAEETRVYQSVLEDRKRAVLAFKQSLPD
jgi:septal ring factor EnvC (AmiA/AmiB activator)